MKRKKATVYLDPDLLRATKVRAAREDKAEYVVIEEALRKHLGLELLKEIWARAELSEEEALRIAYTELDAARRDRRR